MIAKANRVYKYMLPVLAAIVLCLVLLPGTVKAEDATPTSGTCGENLNWSYADGTLLIETNKTITHMDNYSKTEVAPWNEYYKDEIKKVVIRIGDYGTIGAYAFADCKKLESIDIAKGDLDEIGSYAFSGCSSLTTITNIEKVTKLGSYVFSGCDGFTTFKMPDAFTGSIPASAFANCTGLQSVDLNKSPEIGASAFSGCTSLSTITNIEKVTKIGSAAFTSCQALTTFTIPASLDSVPSSLFSGCSNLESVDLNNTTSIGRSAFYSCTKLDNINLKGITAIDNYAFANCAGLQTIINLDELESIGAEAFIRCSNLKDFLLSNNTSLKSIGKNAFSQTGLKSITLPATLESIADSAFTNNTSLETVDFNYAAVNIGSSAFSGCTSLQYFSNIDNIKEIGSSAFSNCKSLQEFKIPDRVKQLNSNTFANCTGLRKVYLPASIEEIPVRYESSSPFSGCSSTLILYIQPASRTSGWSIYYNYYDNRFGSLRVVSGIEPEVYSLCNPNNPDITSVDLSSLSTIPNNAFENCTGLETVILNSDKGTEIGGAAFSGCSNLKTIENLEKVSSIGASAFSGCKALTEFRIPDGINVINSGVFRDCTGLETVILNSDKETEIGSSAFSGCSSLKTIGILEKVSSIGDSAFSGCQALTEFRIPDGIDTINQSTFANCTGLKKVYIPESVTTIKAEYISSSPFYGCSANLILFFGSLNNTYDSEIWKHINYGNQLVKTSYGVTSELYEKCDPNKELVQIDLSEFIKVPDYAFYNTTGLKEITIPSTVESVGDFAFNCSADLELAYVYSADCEIEDDAFGANANPLLLYAVKDSKPYNYAVNNRSKNILAKELTICEQHTADMLDYYPTDPSTCTHAGYEEYWKCKVCGTIFSDEKGQTIGSKKMIEMIDHAPAEAVYENEIEATCENTGSYDEVIYCSRCGYEMSRNPIVVEKLPHSLNHVEAKDATCTEAGNIEYWGCTTCGKYFSDEAGENQIAEDAWVVSATGHSWSEVEYTWVDDHSTVTASRQCAVCNVLETETVAADLEYIPATCEEDGSNGWRSYAFENPEFVVQTQTEVIPALGHDWGEWTLVKEASETETGEEIRVCDRDASHTESRAIPKLGHVHGLVKIDAVAATCTEEGNIEYWICSEGEEPCGRYFSDADGVNEINYEDTLVDALGHTPGETVRENEIQPTETEPGSYEEVVYCTACGEELSRTFKTISPIGSGDDPGKQNPGKEDSVPVKKATTITLKNKSVTYNGKAQAIGAAVVKGSTGKITYSYYSDRSCTRGIKAAKVKNAGTYYVKASVAADTKYKGATSKAVKFVIKPNNKKQKVKLTGKTKTTYSLSYKKNSKFKINATSTGDGTLIYKSTDTKVVKVNQKGKVTIVGSGTAIITIQAQKTKNCPKASAIKRIKVMVHPYELLKTKSGVYFIHITDPSFNKNKNKVPQNKYGIKVKYADTKKPKEYSILKSNQAQLQHLAASAKAKKGTITIYFIDFENNYKTISYVTVKDFKLDKKKVYVKVK